MPYTIIAPTPITDLPVVPQRNHPQFSQLAYALFTTMAGSTVPDINAAALNMQNNALAAQEQAQAAADSAAEALGSSIAAQNAAGATAWVSGGTYTAGSPPSTPPSVKFDPATPGRTFRCILSVSGSATAPKDDPTHWAELGTELKSIRSSAVALAASAIDMSLGDVFTKTITANTTFTVSNVPPSGTVGGFELRLTNAGSKTITFFAGLKWPGKVLPTFTAAGTDRIFLQTDDGGTTWWASILTDNG